MRRGFRVSTDTAHRQSMSESFGVQLSSSSTTISDDLVTSFVHEHDAKLFGQLVSAAQPGVEFALMHRPSPTSPWRSIEGGTSGMGVGMSALELSAAW